ncbi:MAG: hypothetical protein VYE68_02605 [Acidobacteriota bacterium]|nr:hypothetical protein [Acidobacteriota bacterium]
MLWARLVDGPYRTFTRRIGAMVSCLLLIASASCEKVPLLAPTASMASIITVLASRDVLPINGTAQIMATVVEQSGTAAHNGTLVTFTTTLGTLDPQEAVTSNGQATVMLRAGTQSGVAQVSAFSGSASSETPDSTSHVYASLRVPRTQALIRPSPSLPW